MGNSDYGTICMRVGRDDGELRPWSFIRVYSIESRLIRKCGQVARLTTGELSQLFEEHEEVSHSILLLLYYSQA